MTLFLFCFLPFKLLDKKKKVHLKDMGEDLECLCQIMKTVGPKLDHEKARVSLGKRLASPKTNKHIHLRCN